ncbi:MAG: hypothetical protein NT087_08645 [Deltaproteobacteria bacterium]|nr:hypothetical protein [Deltaproteobacteria bacterium]
MRNTGFKKLGAILAFSLLSAATLAWAATDYSAMTNEELAAKRGSMKQATVEERNAFQNEWQNRVQKMSPEEKQKVMGQPENAPRDGSGQKSGQGQGMGSGSGAGGGMGSGSGSGGMGSGSGSGGMGSGSGGMGRGDMGGGGRR